LAVDPDKAQEGTTMKVIGMLVVLIIAFWVFSDARSRGKSISVAFGWFLGTLLLLIFFLPLWLIVRPKRYPDVVIVNKPKLCAHCGKYFDGIPAFCPNCGNSLR
jgi:energy-coupling factor transporter transmembrane protein EcfT